ncbi:uncharacterized protein RAG0_16028 [Rhynchosporium agropyri]|uniref:Uncharacterized protein n=1 Tax=Rhynchosporium agropyri TaxID=914238 RepID=A0A1E1LNG9_9HELO|nr:uncharacterized protein RAG0_16028 [Rhynchosporium agropyri]
MTLPGTLGYTAAKHAAAALEARSHGIRVNAIFPGFFLTDLLKPVIGTVVPTAYYDTIETRQGRTAQFGRILELRTSYSQDTPPPDYTAAYSKALP